MYTPEKFKVEDPAVVRSFIEGNAFGLLLSHDGEEIHDTHTPFILGDEGLLRGHLARANPQWRAWSEGTQVKVVFSGPHAYVSPGYYQSDFNVPTWNYTAVSVSGVVSVIEDREEVLEFLDDLVARNESGAEGWTMPWDDERYLTLLDGIVVFSVLMERVEASFKLSQNKGEEDRCGVIQALEQTGCPMQMATADLMKREGVE